MKWNKWIDYFLYWFPIVYSIMLIGYIIFLSHNGNPLFWRLTPTSGHTLVLIGILSFIAYIRYFTKRGNQLKWIFSVLLVLALIELPWQIVYFFSTQNIDKLSILSHTWISLLLIFGFIGCSSLIRADKIFDRGMFLVAFIMLCIFFAIWYTYGFHITIDSSFTNPKTIYYYDLRTNLFEIGQWWYGLLLFGFSFRLHKMKKAI